MPLPPHPSISLHHSFLYLSFVFYFSFVYSFLYTFLYILSFIKYEIPSNKGLTSTSVSDIELYNHSFIISHYTTFWFTDGQGLSFPSHISKNS